MLISLIYKSLTKMHAVFRAFRAIYNFVLHMLNFLVDTSVQISIFLLYLIISSLSSGRTPIATSEEV